MKLLILLIMSVPLLAACGPMANRTALYQDPSEVSFELTGEITDQEEAEKALQVIEDNLAYAEEADLDNYLDTLVESAREETGEELGTFFEEYVLEHTLLDAEVVEQAEDSIRIETEQQTILVESEFGDDEYRDHVSENSYVLVKEDGEWKIQESIATDTRFLPN